MRLPAPIARFSRVGEGGLGIFAAGLLVLIALPMIPLRAQNCDNATDGGLISGDETGCPALGYDPAPILSVEAPSGGSGTLEIVWIFTTLDPNLPSSEWDHIPNSNSLEYDPGPITQTTWFRRCARRAGCTAFVAESNIVVKEVNCCDNVLDGGQIGFDQEFCGLIYDPAPLENLALPSGGSGVMEYLWYASVSGPPFDPANGWFPITGSNAPFFDPGPVIQTTYFVRTARRQGCTDYVGVSNIVVVEEKDLMQLSAEVVRPAPCQGQPYGSIDLTVTNGLPPYTYSWHPDLGNVEDPQNLAPNVYSVDVTDSLGCTASLTVDVFSLDSFDIELQARPACFGQNDGWARVEIDGGPAPFQILWDTPDSAASALITDLAPGWYRVSVTNADGCTLTDSIEVRENPPLSAQTGSTNATCTGLQDGTAFILMSGGSPPYEYLWSDPLQQVSDTAAGLNPGTYFVTVTDTLGCTYLDTVNVGADAVMTAEAVSEPPTCFDGSDGSAEVVNIVNGEPPFTYQWDDPLAQTTPQATGLAAGIYNVTVTEAGGCQALVTVQVEAPPQMQVAFRITDTSCSGAEDGAAEVDSVLFGTAPFSFTWSDSAGTVGPAISGLLPGTYFVTVEDANGCTAVDTAEVTAGPLLPLTLQAVDESCAGAENGSASVLEVQGGTAPFSYEWNDINFQTTQTATGLTPGLYGVTVYDSKGCFGMDTVRIQPGGQLQVQTSAVDESCFGAHNGSATVDTVLGGVGPYAYEWSDIGFQTTRTATDLAPGTYVVTVSDSQGCQGTDSVQVQAGQALALTLTHTDETCSPAENGSAEVVEVQGGTAPFSYEWSDPNFQSTATAQDLAPGTYFVTVVDALGCEAVDSVTIAAGSPLELTLQVNGVSCSAGDDGLAAVIGISGGTAPYTYEWDDPNFQATQIASGLAPGSYTVTVTDANGCTGIATAVVSGPDSLSLDFAVEHVACGGSADGSATVSVSGGAAPYTYLWDDPAAQTTATASGLAAGTYSVTVTDANACSTVGSVEIQAPADLDLLIDVQNETCPGAADGAIAITLLNGNPDDYTFTWSDPALPPTPSVSGLSGGTYQVSITGQDGCTDVEQITIGAPHVMTLTLFGQDPTCPGEADGSLSIQVSGGTPPYAFQWDDPAQNTDSVLTDIPAGTYTVTVTDAQGCTQTQTTTLDEPSAMQLTFSVQDATCPQNDDGAATVSVIGGHPPYEVSWDDPLGQLGFTASNLLPGVYQAAVFDSLGCLAVGTVTVGSLSDLAVALSTQEPTCAGAANGSVLVTPTGGVAPYQFSWSTGETDSLLSGLGGGSYEVTLTDGLGCTVSEMVELTEPSPLEISFAVSNPLCPETPEGQATAEVQGGTPAYTYAWNDPAAQTTPTAVQLTAGTYTVTVTDANGCSAENSVLIEGSSDLALSLSSSSVSCSGGNDGQAAVTPVGGQAPFEAVWSNGASGLAVSGLSAGTYAVTLTDGNGCSVSHSVAVSEPEALTCSAQVVQPVSTHGGSDGIAGGSADGGTAPYTFQWSNGDEGPTADSLSAGQWHLTVTDANGCLCTATVDMPQPASLGDFVWHDQNENGIQDAGEPGMPDVEITLEGTTSAGVTVNLTTLSDADGRYRFNALDPGLYRLRFAPPDQYGFTTPNAANDQVDSDVNPATGMTDTLAVLDGQENLSVDAGFVALDEPVTLGDFVWLDANRNGLQDSGETGIPGVVVRLLRMPGATVQATTTTDFLGEYHFQDVAPGDYAIEFLSGSLPTGYVFTAPNVGADESLDSDVDTALGRIPTFTVQGYAPDNLDLDAGAYPVCDNVTTGGQVGYSEQLCGMGTDPAEIIELVPPTGGFGALEFQWLQSDVPVFNGPGDPNWTHIPGATQATYDPGPLNQTTYYIRCVRREGCTEFSGESNIVEKEIVELPLALIEQAPDNLCDGEAGTFKAANAGAGSSYHWDFGSATPSTADTRIVTGVSWAQPGTYVVTLTVTRFGCSQSSTALVDVNDCLAPLLRIEPFSATLEGEVVALRWQTGPAPEGTLFSIQRSENGQDFHTIGMLSTASESTEGYSFLDTAPLKGLGWYRIGYQLPDGGSGYSDLRSVFYQPPGMPDFFFYPNPVGNHGRLDILKPHDEPLEVLLINGFGTELRRWTVPAGASALEMELTKLPLGIYYLQVIAPGRRPLVQKVVKE